MVDTTAPQRIARLMPLADALARIERLVDPVAPRRIALADALGRTRASGMTAAGAYPAVAIALRDGIAVRAEATLDAGSYAPVRVAATPVEVGDPLPAGADAVAPADAVELRGADADVLAPLAPGDGVLPAGGDMAAGEPLRRITRRLRGVDLAALAILGVTKLEVRAPRVHVAAASAAPGPVIAAAVGMLARAVEGAGGSVVATASADHDATILVGGSGAGRRDQTVRELARRGTVAFHGVGLTPGETAAFATIDQRPVLVVPGRLDAALAVWLTLGRCLLARLAGCKENAPAEPGVLARKVSSALGLAEVVPVARHGDALTPLAAGYLTLQSLTGADGYILVPADREGFPEGTRVEMMPLP
jgi:molybdopterin biosynthesis enzyme